MKITTLLIFAFMMHVSAATFAQRVTIRQNNITLKQFFKIIQAQTGYDVLYQPEKVNGDATINVDFKDTPLLDALNKIIPAQGLTFSIDDKTIIIKKIDENSLDKVKDGIKASVAQITVTGKVTNELDEPIPGVTVKQKTNPNNGTVTDAKGNYTLIVPDDKTVIVFSFIGYEPQELQAKNIVNGSTITLKISSTNLKEVVINKGYYNTTQLTNTGDVSSIKSKDIATQPINNVMEAIEGRVPGLFIKQSNGLAGSGISAVSQGRNSLINGYDPLYVIDGVPYNSELFEGSGSMLGIGSNGGTATYGSPLSYLNPYDIESIDILKDADATAIYGSRGANGVILITTKKGKAGKTKVDFNVNQGVGKVSHFLDLLNTQQWLQLRHEAFNNDQVTPTLPNAADLLLWDTTRYTNWQKQLIGGTSQFTDAQLGISGGNTNTQFLISGDFHRQTTVFPGDFADKKGSLHFNLNHTSDNQKFKATLSASYLSDNNLLPGADMTSYIFLQPDALPPLNPDGTLNWAHTPTGTYTWNAANNPQAVMDRLYNTEGKNLVANSVLSYKILSNLEVKASLGYTTTQMNEQSTEPVYAQDPALNPNSLTFFTNYTATNWIIEPQVNYSVNLGKGKLNALLGGTFEENTINGQYLYGSGFSSDQLLLDLQAATSFSVFNVTNTDYRYSAIYSRIGYSWNDRYILNLTERRDGSSRFGPNKQFHDFGAIAGAYVFSNENFFKKAMAFLSTGKLRFSYGTSGSDQITDYQFLNSYGTNSYLPYNGSTGLTPSSLYNPNLAWEESKKWSYGLDLGFLNDRFFLSIDYFKTLSSNQLIGYLLPSITGFTSISENLPATIQNTGFEVLINTTDIKSKDFMWKSSLNFTIPQNKLVAFPNLSTSSYKNTYVIGQPVDIRKTYQYAGVNPTTGLYQYLNAQGQLTSSPNSLNDKIQLENIDPKVYGGFQNTFSYKNFELNVFFEFVKQTGLNLLYSDPYGLQPGYKGYNQPVQVLNNWKAPGNNAPFEMLSQSTGSAAYNAWSYINQSSAAYTDVSYLRLKNVELSYALPETLMRKIHVQGCRVFVQGENVLTFTNHYYGLDPETQSITSLPLLRMISIGFHLTL